MERGVKEEVGRVDAVDQGRRGGGCGCSGVDVR